jgi:ATP adenylyltransferase
MAVGMVAVGRTRGRRCAQQAGRPVNGQATPGGIPLEEQAGVGMPDAFQRLYTPHRMAYIKGEGRADENVCPFCQIPGMTDEDGLVVARGGDVYAVLNLYPYNAGHLMVVPYRHVADYADLTAAEATEMAFFMQKALRALRLASGAHGFNTGMNLGSVAGAGIAGHVHQHVVPRWGGDTNFMPIVGGTRVLPALLPETRSLIAEAWEKINAES